MFCPKLSCTRSNIRPWWEDNDASYYYGIWLTGNELYFAINAKIGWTIYAMKLADKNQWYMGGTERLVNQRNGNSCRLPVKVKLAHISNKQNVKNNHQQQYDSNELMFVVIQLEDAQHYWKGTHLQACGRQAGIKAQNYNKHCYKVRYHQQKIDTELHSRIWTRLYQKCCLYLQLPSNLKYSSRVWRCLLVSISYLK